MAEGVKPYSRIITAEEDQKRVVSIRDIRGDIHPEHAYPGLMSLSVASSSDFGIELIL